MVATPHGDKVPSIGGKDALAQRIQVFREEVTSRGIELDVMMGAEHLLSADLLAEVQDGTVISINSSRYLLVEAQVQLEQLNETILSSTSEGDGISLLSVVSGALSSPTLPLQREESLLATGVQTVDFLMYFLGHESPKKYLLVGQNDDEIRATGGFIGVVAELTLDKGELTGLIFYDTTTVDSLPYDTNPLPPEAIYRYLWMGKLLFCDGNWNPPLPCFSSPAGGPVRAQPGGKGGRCFGRHGGGRAGSGGRT